MPAVRYNLTPLGELENRNKDDIIGVLYFFTQMGR